MFQNNPVRCLIFSCVGKYNLEIPPVNHFQQAKERVRDFYHTRAMEQQKDFKLKMQIIGCKVLWAKHSANGLTLHFCQGSGRSS